MSFRFLLLLIGFIFGGAFSGAASAVMYDLPGEKSRLVGQTEYYQVEHGDSLASIANRFNLGPLALLEANKGVDLFLPEPGTLLTIPSKIILPDVEYQGIVINLAELRLYYFPQDDASVYVFPIGIGRIGRETPEMDTYVVSKIEAPVWRPTENIRQEYLEKYAVELPAEVPPGPDNPLGDYALRLGQMKGEYLIHGTNMEFGIGMRVSAGCIRMNPEDIAWLFDQVTMKDRVQIINQPVKQTIEPDGALFVEVHAPLSKTEQEQGKYKKLIVSEGLKSMVASNTVAENRLKAVFRLQGGIPIEIMGGVAQ